MLQIIIERSAEKELKRIATEIRPKLASAIRSLAGFPREVAVPELL